MTGGTIELERVSVRFGRTLALDEVSARFDEGSMTAVVGPNGAGKSTLLRAVMGLVRLSHGRVARHGLQPGDIAYLPQLSGIDRSVPIDVIDLVSLGAWSRTGLLRSLSADDEARVRRAVARVGLQGLERTAIGHLSGGQLQRALFARLIVQDAAAVLLDEPFAAVDAGTVADLMALLTDWHREGRTIVAVLHDMALARRDFPQTLSLETRLLEQGRSLDVLRDDAAAPRLRPMARSLAAA